MNGKDDTLYQKHFRVNFRRILKQGRECLDIMAHKAAFRIIKIIFALIFAKSGVFGVFDEITTNYNKGFGN